MALDIVSGEAITAELLQRVADSATGGTSTTSGNGSGVPNGSFESPVVPGAAIVIPDGWSFVPMSDAAATGSKIDNADSAEGGQSFKIVCPGGASNQGGQLFSPIMECSPNKPLILSWQTKSSVATIENLASVRFYTTAANAQSDVILTEQSIYSNSTTNPTAWGVVMAAAFPPATARYCRLKITGANNATEGTVWIDDVEIKTTFANRAIYKNTGINRFHAPPGVHAVLAKLWGAGAGGVMAAGYNSAGGGGGAYCEGFVTVTPDTDVLLTVGAGGGAVGYNTVNGSQNSTIGGLLAGGGYTGFAYVDDTIGAPGGNGGTAAGGYLNISGGPGGRAFSSGLVDANWFTGGGGHGACGGGDGLPQSILVHVTELYPVDVHYTAKQAEFPGAGGSGGGDGKPAFSGADGMIELYW